jgi:hypothetical protein
MLGIDARRRGLLDNAALTLGCRRGRRIPAEPSARTANGSEQVAAGRGRVAGRNDWCW